MRIKLVFPAPKMRIDERRVLNQLGSGLSVPRNPVKTVTTIGAIRLFPTLFSSSCSKRPHVHVSVRIGYSQIYMMALFVICVRLPEILYQKTLQPKCPGISGVRQPYQLRADCYRSITISAESRSPPFLQAHVFVYGVDTDEGFLKDPPTDPFSIDVHDQSPCCVVYIVCTTSAWKTVADYIRSRGFMKQPTVRRPDTTKSFPLVPVIALVARRSRLL